METALTNFALAAAAVALAVYIVKAVVPLLQPSAPKSSEETGFGRHREIVRDALDSSVVPLLRQQVAILDELKTLASAEEGAHLRIQLSVDELKEGQGKTRDSLHRIAERMQVFAAQQGKSTS